MDKDTTFNKSTFFYLFNEYLEDNDAIKLMINKHLNSILERVSKETDKVIKRQKKEKLLNEYLVCLVEYMDKLHDDQKAKFEKQLDDMFQEHFRVYKEETRYLHKDVLELKNTNQQLNNHISRLYGIMSISALSTLTGALVMLFLKRK